VEGGRRKVKAMTGGHIETGILDDQNGILKPRSGLILVGTVMII
jgi:hypothetical protein